MGTAHIIILAITINLQMFISNLNTYTKRTHAITKDTFFL